ncbi:hypothetical protein [Brevundimonas sp. FT23028]|uniref:hypothetical protein n=1 Tax=Brevundimonas sp. FT23028 TaxID=3393748 RepID=UPI003B586716
MKTMLSAGLAMALGLGAATTATAQDDDWEFQQDPAQNIAIAVTRYDAGQIIVVQCRDNRLTVVLGGLPRSTEPLELTASRADGRSDIQDWVSSGAPGAFRAVSPGRAARFLKGGGLYSVRTEPGSETPFTGAFDLPGQSANVDQVLTACGWGLSDDRDLLAEAEVSLENVGPTVHRRSSSRSVALRSRRPNPNARPAPRLPTPEMEVSCIVRSGHLAECRADHAASAALPPVMGVMRAAEGREVFPIDGATLAEAEGKVFHVIGHAAMLRFAPD